jgi:hypothetical protein
MSQPGAAEPPVSINRQFTRPNWRSLSPLKHRINKDEVSSLVMRLAAETSYWLMARSLT